MLIKKAAFTGFVLTLYRGGGGAKLDKEWRNKHLL